MAKDIVIIGGGIAGLTTSISLNKIGFHTSIFEATPKMEIIGAGLGLGANAMVAFERLGILEEVVTCGRILPFFSILDQEGKIINHTNSKQLRAKYGLDNFTVHRAELHSVLLSKIDGQSFHTGKKAIHFEQKEDGISIRFKDGSMHKADFLIVADGIHSVFRKKLLPNSEPRYAGYTCWRAVIENPGINLKGSSETWGDKGRFGIVPLAGNKIYWYACVNAKQNDPGYQKFKVSDLLGHFRNFHEPIPSILKNTSDHSLIWNDIIDLKPIEKFAFENILLIGDAAHATTPNMGQGACQAIEDAVVLASELSKSNDVKQAFRNFEKRRMKRTHFITKASWRLGKVAQLENKLLIKIRNNLFRNMPSWLNEKQLKKLYRVDF